MSQPANTQQQQQQHNVAIDVDKQIGNQQPPSNQQISELVDKTQQYLDQRKNDPNISQQTVKAVSDFQGVLQATEQLNQNKNQDEALQNVILETGAAGQDIAQKGKQISNDPNVQQKAGQFKEQGKQLTQTIWSLIRMMIQNGEFRGQVNSFIGVFQEMFGGIQQGESVQQQAQQVADQGLSDQKKHEIAFQFLTILRKLNGNPQLKSGFQQLTDLFQELSDENSYSTGQQAPHQEMKDTIKGNEHIDNAFQESKKVIERFTERPLDPFLVKNRELFSYIRSNDAAREWFNRFIQFVREAFEKPDQMDEYEFTKRAEDLVNDANALSKDPQLKAKYTHVFSELRAIGSSIKDDPDLKNLQEQTAAFLDNFTTVDANGQRAFNSDLMKDLQSFIVPLFLAQLDNIPLPPVDGSNQDYDYHFDNMVLHGQEIVPDMVRIHSQSDTQMNVRDLHADHANTRVFLQIASIQMKISDIHFTFTRKTFPKMSDQGTANVRVEGDQGFSLKLELKVEMSEQGAPRFHLQQVDADIQKLKIDIIEAKHDFLLKLFAGIYQTRTKRMIEESIEKNIREAFGKIEEGLNNVFARFPPSKLKDMVSQKANQALNSGAQQESQQQKTQGQQSQVQQPQAFQS